MLHSIINNKKSLFIIILTLILFLFHFSLSYSDENSKNKLLAKIEGNWKVDYVDSVSLRVERGVPWHVDSKAPDRWRIELEKGNYKIISENDGSIFDIGKFNVYQIVNGEITIRLFPKHNNFKCNNLKFDELMPKYTSFAGDKIPYVMGFKIMDENRMQSFSWVRGVVNNVSAPVKKYDNLIWVRVNKE